MINQTDVDDGNKYNNYIINIIFYNYYGELYVVNTKKGSTLCGVTKKNIRLHSADNASFAKNMLIFYCVFCET